MNSLPPTWTSTRLSQMPSVGTYWYDRGGRPTVVRVVADDGPMCAYFDLNPVQQVRQVRYVTTAQFGENFQTTPSIADEWLGVGTHWYWRDDLTEILEVVSVQRGPSPPRPGEHQIMRVTTRDHGTIGVTELTSRYIRIDGDVPTSDTRYWVMGRGIRAPFVSEVNARAFLFETTTALGIQRGALRVYPRPLTYRPGNDHLLALEAPLPPMVDQGEGQPTTGLGSSLWSAMNGNERRSLARDALQLTVAEQNQRHIDALRLAPLPPPRLTRAAAEQAIQAILGTIPEIAVVPTPMVPVDVNVTVTCDPPALPSLWDHLTADEETP